MGRASRAEAAERREQVVSAASHLFRERGPSVSVADLMAQVGLTHGGFYKQFSSKDALLAEATAQAFDDLHHDMEQLDAQHRGDHDAARLALLEHYLSTRHRDDLAGGCPAAGFSADITRESSSSPAREHYTRGVADLASWLGAKGGAAASPARGLPSAAETSDATSGLDDDALVALSTMVGALALARATAGSPLSERLLRAAREALHPTTAAGQD